MENDTRPEADDGISTIKKIFNEIPLIYKHLVLQPKWLLLLSGKTAQCEQVIGSAWIDSEIQSFADSLAEIGFQLMEQDGKNGNKTHMIECVNPSFVEKQDAAQPINYWSATPNVDPQSKYLEKLLAHPTIQQLQASDENRESKVLFARESTASVEFEGAPNSGVTLIQKIRNALQGIKGLLVKQGLSPGGLRKSNT